MKRRGWIFQIAAVVLLQVLLLSRFTWRGAACLPVPALTVWTGLTDGADRGAAGGLWAGGLLYLLGGSPWEMGILSLIGGLSGAFLPQGKGFRLLLSLPVLAGWELLRLLALWCSGGNVLAALPLLGREYLLCLSTLPLAGVFCRRKRKKQLPPGGRERKLPWKDHPV